MLQERNSMAVLPKFDVKLFAGLLFFAYVSVGRIWAAVLANEWILEDNGRWVQESETNWAAVMTVWWKP